MKQENVRQAKTSNLRKNKHEKTISRKHTSMHGQDKEGYDRLLPRPSLVCEGTLCKDKCRKGKSGQLKQ